MGVSTAARILVLFVASLMVISGVPAPATATADVTLTVSVVNANGNPVENAELTAEWANGSTTARTASNGKAFLDVPEGADVAITVSHPNFVRNFPVEVDNATEQEVTVDVRRKGTLSVEVTDANGPVEDARVVLREEGRIVDNLRTDASGTVQFTSIEQREYSVAVRKERYFIERFDVVVNSSTDRAVSLETGTVTLTVRVVDDHFDPPRSVANATVRVGEFATIRTLDDGRQTVSIPVNTDFSLEVTKDAYETTTSNVQVGESDTTVNVTISRSPLLNLTAGNERIVAGESVVVTVRDEYGDPVEGVRIELDGEAVGETDADGQLRVQIDDPGDHELVAVNDSLRSSPISVRAIEESAETTQPQTTSPAPETATVTPTETTFPGFTAIGTLAAVLLAVGIVVWTRD